MLFNSTDFAIFLPVVFLIYWFICKNNLKSQNRLLLLSSYFFYASWDWRFLFLLFFSTILDFYTGLKMESSRYDHIRKRWFWLSVFINLGFLMVFKYYDFFIQSFAQALSQFGLKVNPGTLNIVLPVGISFYTFHGLSYVIDIYNRKIKAERDFTNYAVFVSYFPLLVAGPIERATHLLPQIKSERFFKYSMAVDGLRQILWGLFKKIVIADNCAQHANYIFDNYSSLSGSTLALGAIFFAFQIYGDFSGYSDIALGTSRLFGIELLKNFSYPYFSRDIAEFWRRWHISLSSWFRDYLYVPLGGSRGGVLTRIRNTFIIFIVSGFWHGANWTFIAWGALNAVYFLPLLIAKRNRYNLDMVATGRIVPTLNESLSILITFSLTVLAWIFFRSPTISDAVFYIDRLFSSTLFSNPVFEGKLNAGITLFFIFLFMTIEWIGRQHSFAIKNLDIWMSRPFRYAFYYAVIILIMTYGGAEQQFIYFQF